MNSCSLYLSWPTLSSWAACFQLDKEDNGSASVNFMRAAMVSQFHAHRFWLTMLQSSQVFVDDYEWRITHSIEDWLASFLNSDAKACDMTPSPLLTFGRPESATELSELLASQVSSLSEYGTLVSVSLVLLSPMCS